jgi:sec-independent protein translocase protein TatC
MSAPAPQLPSGRTEPENEVRLTFVEHLRDLRKRLARALLGVVVGMALVGGFVERIFHLLMQPVLGALPENQRTLHFTSSIEPLMVYMKVAIYGGIFVAAPWVLWQLWLFIAPGLYKREKKVVVPFLFFGTLLFYAGGAFCLMVVMPLAFPAMISIVSDSTLAPMLTMSAQLSLVLAMILGFGIIFEVPVVIAFLSLVGLVNVQTLTRFRRYAILVNVIAAAVLTPTGDPLNLALMAVPMVVFYEIGIILARVLGKRPEPDEAIAKA